MSTTDNASSIYRKLREPVKWHFLQVLGVCTCFIGYRTLNMFPKQLFIYSGAYLVPYYVGLVLVVLPVLFVQMKLGGTTGRNIVSLFSRYTPILKGVGMACIMQIFIKTIANNVFVAYGLFFTFSSLIKPYTWATCNNVWNNDACNNQTSSIIKGYEMPEQQFFDYKVLSLSPGISAEGTISWELGLSLAAAWAITFLIVFGGARYFGWIMAITGSIGMIIAVALVAYGREELEHLNAESVLYNMTLNRLMEPSAAQAVLSIWLEGILEGVAMLHLWQGVLPTVGKYASRGSECNNNGRWLLLFVFVCVSPHLFINLLVVYISPLAASAGVSLATLMESGPRTLFVILPAAMHHLELGRGLAFITFLLIVIVLANMQALFTLVAVDNLDDAFRQTMKKCCSRKIGRCMLICALYCIAGLLLGLPNITQAGFYLVQLIHIWIDRLIFIIVFLSMVAFAEAYAKQHFSLVERVVILIWFVVASLFTTATCVYKAGLHKDTREVTVVIRHGVTYTYPQWAYILGWFIAAGPIVIGLLYGAMHACAVVRGKGSMRIITLCTGPPEDPLDDKKGGHRRSAMSDSSSAVGYLKPSF